MLAFELSRANVVIGIGKKEEIDLIQQKKLFIKKNGEQRIFRCEMLEPSEFPNEKKFDFLFVTTKNPVGPVVKYYYQKIKEKKIKPPPLFLSQNGIEAGEEAILSLKEIFGKNFEKIPVFRISLFNPVDQVIEREKKFIIYSLPLRLAIAKISGPEIDISSIFDQKNFEIFLVSQENAKNMEYSKLFLNLIGMSSATYGLSIKEGFLKKEVFREEIAVLREFKKIASLQKIKFLNFPHYPIKFLSFLISLPYFLLFSFRKILANLIEKGRIKKRKDLDEIDYYNGAIVKIAKKLNIEAPVNSKVLERIKK